MQSSNNRPAIGTAEVLVFMLGMAIGILIGVLAIGGDGGIGAGIGFGAAIGVGMIIALREFR